VQQVRYNVAPATGSGRAVVVCVREWSVLTRVTAFESVSFFLPRCAHEKHVCVDIAHVVLVGASMSGVETNSRRCALMWVWRVRKTYIANV